MTDQAAWLVGALFVAHFLGDFTPLATARMQEAKTAGRPFGPIALHALVHAGLVGAAVAVIARPAAMLVLAAVAIQFWTHFGLDWYRGRLGARHPALANPSRQAFWTALGLDQLAHALILVGIAWLVSS